MHEDLPPLGSTVGPWRILDRLDSGSYGVVFRAQHTALPASPPVALKVARLPEDPRFQREKEALEHCLHSSIPHYEGSGVWTSSTGERYPYLVMEAVDGPTLYEWLRQHPRSSLDVLQVLAQLAGALASAHSRGVIHRDVKGDNIRVTPQGRAVLLDWGSCWLSRARPLTDTPMPPGTSAYRPPEQRAFVYSTRKSFDARWVSRPPDDLYSLGVTLYRLVTGSYLPPCTDGIGPVKRQVPKPSALATVSPSLEALILRLISDDTGARGTAEQLGEETTRLAQAAGPEAQQPILPLLSEAPSEMGWNSSGPPSREEALSDTDPAPARPECWRPRFSPGCLRLLAMSGAAVALMLLVVWPVPEKPQTTWLATPEKAPQFAPDAGVAEEAQASVQELPRAVTPLAMKVGAPMPKKPFDGQRKPPCDPDTEIAVLGACWAVLKKAAPCGPKAFDYEGQCLRASFDAPRQPTSEQP